MPEIVKCVRRRVNVATSVKGVKTFDCTIETEGYSEDETLAMSDTLVRQLEQRYPPQMQ
jgi:hypothetical protein